MDVMPNLDTCAEPLHLCLATPGATTRGGTRCPCGRATDRTQVSRARRLTVSGPRLVRWPMLADPTRRLVSISARRVKARRSARKPRRPPLGPATEAVPGAPLSIRSAAQPHTNLLTTPCAQNMRPPASRRQGRHPRLRRPGLAEERPNMGDQRRVPRILPVPEAMMSRAPGPSMHLRKPPKGTTPCRTSAA